MSPYEHLCLSLSPEPHSSFQYNAGLTPGQIPATLDQGLLMTYRMDHAQSGSPGADRMPLPLTFLLHLLTLLMKGCSPKHLAPLWTK